MMSSQRNELAKARRALEQIVDTSGRLKSLFLEQMLRTRTSDKMVRLQKALK